MAAAIEPLISSSLIVRRAQYVSLLLKHDWAHEWSDDRNAVLRGRESLALLMLEAAEIDPDYTIWNRHAPQGYRKVKL